MSRASQPDLYAFTFGLNGEVTSVAEIERNSRLDRETIERDESYRLIDGLVVKTELDDGQQEWTVYGDADGDGRWVELGEGVGAPDLSLFGVAPPQTEAPPTGSHHDDAYVFQFDGAGQVAAVYEVERDGRLKREDIDADEAYVRVGDVVVRTEHEDGRFEQTIYADADGDGVWLAVGPPQPMTIWTGAGFGM